MAETKKCVICGKEFEGYGNNAEPVAEGLCCNECNMEMVVPARLQKIDDDFKEPDYVTNEANRFVVAGETITVDHKVDMEWLIENLRKCFKDFDVAWESNPMNGLKALVNGDFGAAEEFPADDKATFSAVFSIGKDKFDGFIDAAVTLKQMGENDAAQRMLDFAHMWFSVYSLILMNSKYAHERAMKVFLRSRGQNISRSDKEYVSDVMGLDYYGPASMRDLLEMVQNIIDGGTGAQILAVVKE